MVRTQGKVTVTRSLAMNRTETGAIIGEKGYLAGRIMRIHDGERVLIGRDASQCDILLKKDTVSRVHLSVSYDSVKKVYRICDLSTNGVAIDEHKMMEKKREVEVPPGTRLLLGSPDDAIRLG